MKNGSSPEYFHVEGALKLTRMRQSEWRRRWGIVGLVEFDAQVGAGLDDGHSTDLPAFADTANNTNVGQGSVIDSWHRWDNVTIPAGATIQTAYLTVVCRNSGLDGVGVKTNIYFEDSDDAVAPTTQIEHAADVRTTAFTPWDDIDFIVGLPTNSPSIVDVVQEIVDRGSWVSGNAMMALWDDDGSSGSKFYINESYESDPAKSVKLHVEYSA